MQQIKQSTEVLVAVGSYTPDNRTGSDTPGLVTWWWDRNTAIRPAGSADLPSPSFVCWHPTLPVLYAVSELDPGLLTVLGVDDDGAVTVLDELPSGGSNPCFVQVDPTGTALLIAHYSPGALAVFALDPVGRPAAEPVIEEHRGSGPRTDRQAAAHAHQAVPTAEGNVLVTDLGGDFIAEYRIDTDADTDALEVQPLGVTALNPGSGPRHIALAADGITGFVTGELDATVLVVRRIGAFPDQPARWTAVTQVPSTLRTDVPAEEVYPSHLALACHDRWLLVANRGTNTIAVLDPEDDLAVRHEVQTGAWVRHFVVVDDVVLAACERADSVQAFRIDAESGALTDLGVLGSPDGPARLHRPACVAVHPGA